MFRRFHHGHAAAGGFLLALALTAHTLWLVSAALVLGIVIGRAWATWALWTGALREKVLHAKRERIATGVQPVYSARKTQTDTIPF